MQIDTFIMKVESIISSNDSNMKSQSNTSKYHEAVLQLLNVYKPYKDEIDLTKLQEEIESLTLRFEPNTDKIYQTINKTLLRR